MTQDALPLPEWPAVEHYVVSYVLDGRIHATRHVAGCAMLQGTRTAMDLGDHSRLRPDIQNLSVLEEDRYNRLVWRGSMPAPKGHVCIKGKEATTASFRDAERST